MSNTKQINSNFNPFVTNAPFPYPLEMSENRKAFWCFQGVEKGCIGNEWVKLLLSKEFCNLIGRESKAD